MQRLLTWSSTAILLIMTFAIASCTSMTEEERRAEERKRETARIAKELGRTERREERKKARKKKKAKKKKDEELTVEQLCSLTISTDKKEYTVGEPIKLTITYKNIDDERIQLVADGETADNGFSGEMVIIKRRNFKDPYTFLPKNLTKQEQIIYPNESWSHTIEDLEAVLQQDAVRPLREREVAVGGMQTEREKALAVLDLPRFQKPDDYTLQVIYYPNQMESTLTMKEKEMMGKDETDEKGGKVYSGPTTIDSKLESNILRLEVRRKE